MKMFERLMPLARREVLRKYVQFCIIGGTGVAVDMAIIWLLASPAILGWNLTLSKVLAAEVAIFSNFLWNDLWTFRDMVAGTDWSSRLIRLGKFNLICAAGIVISVLLLNLQVYGLKMNLYLANLCSIIVVSVWNFYMNLRFGWTQPVADKAQDQAALIVPLMCDGKSPENRN